MEHKGSILSITNINIYKSHICHKLAVTGFPKVQI